MRAIFCIISILFLSVPTYAQKISVAEFLNTAGNDIRLINKSEIIDYIEGSPSKVPFLDRVELRTRSDQFDISKQRYSVRISPNSIGEIREHKKSMEKEVAINKAEYNLLYHRVLKRRYALVIDYLREMELIELKKQQIALYEDKLKVMQLQRNSLDFDINDLIETENKLTNYQLDLVDSDNDIIGIQEKMRNILDREGVLSFDTSAIVNMELIEQLVDSIGRGDSSTMPNVYLSRRYVMMQYASERYDQESTSNKTNVGYMEAIYENEDRALPKDAFRVGFGLRLPISNSNDPSIYRSKMREIDRKNDYEELKNEIADQQDLQYTKIKGLIKQYKILKEIKGLNTAQKSFSSYFSVEGMPPLTLIKLKESILGNEERFSKLKYTIFGEYIEFLDISGVLSLPPLKNYLSEELSGF